MQRPSGGRSRRIAPALRFLILYLGGWSVLRVAMSWTPQPPPPLEAPWTPPSPFAVGAVPLAFAPAHPPTMRGPQDNSAHAGPAPVAIGTIGGGRPAAGDGRIVADRHGLRLALIAPFLKASGGEVAAFTPQRSALLPASAAARAQPGGGEPFWMQRPVSGWSGSGWLYLRQDSGASPGGIAAIGQLGGSQAGVRIARSLGEDGRSRAYVRATIAIERPRQRELALGIAYAPLSRLPIDFAIEQRVALGREGRTTWAVMAAGGVGDVPLPGGFRLDAYGQAGIVGMHRRDGFVDGAVVVDRRLGLDDGATLRLGALAAGAVQPGASRLDVGPRLTLRLPHIGEGGRIAVDWRQRVAGNARPEDGLALTLATDF